MRYMIIVRANAHSEADAPPARETVAATGRFNEALARAGVLLAAESLRSTRHGALIAWRDGRFSVTDGPFTETGNTIAGFWMVDVKDRAEAIEWIKRTRFEEGDVIELRKVFEASDWAGDTAPPDWVDQRERLRT